MENVSRISLLWFLAWATVVVSMVSAAANSEISPVAIQDELAREIEGLEVINQINSGSFDSRHVAIQGDTEVKNQALEASKHDVAGSLLSPRGGGQDL